MKNKFLILFCMIFLLSFVSAVPPFQVETTDSGLIVEPTIKEYIRTNTAHKFEIHVFNQSNGFPITSGISCYMHLYARDGDHLYEGQDDTVNHLFDYTFDVNESNFTTRGEYQAKFQCNNSDVGGGEEIFFYVNDYGEELSDAESHTFNYSMIFLMILFVMALIGIFTFEQPAGKLACYWIAHVFFVVGTFSVWQFNLGYAIGFVGLAGIWKILFWVSIIAMFPMVLLSLAWIFYIHTMNDDIKKMMERGMDKDEAVARAKSKRRNKNG